MAGQPDPPSDPTPDPTPDQTPVKQHYIRSQGARFGLALMAGVPMLILWVVVCGWAETYNDTLHPGQGAGFFTLVPIVFGWIVCLVVYPLLYMMSRSGSGTGAFELEGLPFWILWLVPIVVYAGIVGFSALSAGDWGETALTAALYFPVLGWRLYASGLDASRAAG